MKVMKSMLLALALSGLAMGASAQMGPGAESGHMGFGPCAEGGQWKPEKMQRMAARRAAHAKELHDKLQLNAEQETAWKTMEAAMKPAAERKRLDIAEMEKLTAPERMEKMIERMKQHEATMGARLDAVKAFYAVLSPEQRQIFDRETLAAWKKRSEKYRAGDRIGK